MMIFGIALTASIVGKLLDPYSAQRMIKIVFGLTMLTILLTAIVTLNIERGLERVKKNTNQSQSFILGLKIIWANRQTKRFTIFVVI